MPRDTPRSSIPGGLSSPSVAPLLIAGREIMPGETQDVHIPIARWFDYTPQHITLRVIRGRRPGPTLLISAAIHGDEINGIEIVRRVVNSKRVANLRGTLIAAPIINVFGFNHLSRYLPDRRDLNRCFPGSAAGPLASRIAHVLDEQVLAQCSHAVDLHTGAIHRGNLPQIRAFLDDPEVLAMAHAFGTPVILNSELRDGSLRACAVSRGIPMLLFEGGEALRFEEPVIRSGVRGVISVMRSIGMLKKQESQASYTGFIARGSYWLRAPTSGIVRLRATLGQRVGRDETVGIVADPLGDNAENILAKHEGVVIGVSKLPLASRGDALLHIATFEHLDEVMELVEEFELIPG